MVDDPVAALGELLTRLDDAEGIVQLVADELSQVGPHVIGFCALYRGNPALELDCAAAAAHGAASGLGPGLSEAFARSATLFDRWAVQYSERNRWRTKSLSMIEGSRLAAYWGDAPLAFSRIIVCEGAVPVGYMAFAAVQGHSLPTPSPGFRQKAKTLASILRAVAHRRAKGEARALADRLLQRHDGVAIYSLEGDLLASTPSVRRLAQGDALDAGRSAQEAAAFASEVSLLDGQHGSFRVAHVSLRRPITAPTPAAAFGTLTPREHDIVAALLEGGSNKDIADRLGVKPSSVKSSLERVYQKTGTPGRAELVRWALEHRSAP